MTVSSAICDQTSDEERHTETDRQADMQTDIQTHTSRHKETQTDIQARRPTDRQTRRHTTNHTKKGKAQACTQVEECPTQERKRVSIVENTEKADRYALEITIDCSCTISSFQRSLNHRRAVDAASGSRSSGRRMVEAPYQGQGTWRYRTPDSTLFSRPRSVSTQVSARGISCRA